MKLIFERGAAAGWTICPQLPESLLRKTPEAAEVLR